jgi:hypothetical protein
MRYRGVRDDKSGYGVHMRVAGTTTGFLVVEPRGRTTEQPGRHDDLDAHGPGTVIPLTGKAAARVGAYPDVGRLRSQCDSSATTAEGASPDKRIDIAQDPADESSHTERGEG